MFYTVQKRIKEIIESEAVEGGCLSLIKSVHLGDFKLLGKEKYPALFIDYSEGGIEGFPHKANVNFSFTIFIYVFEKTFDESMQMLDNLYWKDNEDGSSEGIVPALLSNLGFKANNISLRMKIGKTQAVPGKPESDRWSGAMMIPLEVKSVKHLR